MAGHGLNRCVGAILSEAAGGGSGGVLVVVMATKFDWGLGGEGGRREERLAQWDGGHKSTAVRPPFKGCPRMGKKHAWLGVQLCNARPRAFPRSTHHRFPQQHLYTQPLA